MSTNGMEIRNPNNLVIVTKALLKQRPDLVETISKYHDLRAERGLDDGFKRQVEVLGRITDPIKIVQVEDVGDVVIEGRQRVRAAVALGYATIPVIVEDGEAKNAIALELSGNLARSENSILENAFAFKKALTQGMSQATVATIAGVSDVTVLNTIYLGEMPSFIHKMIDTGQLSPTAALQLKKFGKKAAKGSGLSTIYDEEAQKAMKEFLATLPVEAKLKGGGKRISVKQARSSAPNHVENLTNKEWDAIVASAECPVWAANLINAVRGKVSWQTARHNCEPQLNFLRKIEPPPKEKKVKEPKVKESKSKETEVVTEVDASNVNVLDMFQ